MAHDIISGLTDLGMSRDNSGDIIPNYELSKASPELKELLYGDLEYYTT